MELLGALCVIAFCIPLALFGMWLQRIEEERRWRRLMAEMEQEWRRIQQLQEDEDEEGAT